MRACQEVPENEDPLPAWCAALSPRPSGALRAHADCHQVLSVLPVTHHLRKSNPGPRHLQGGVAGPQRAGGAWETPQKGRECRADPLAWEGAEPRGGAKGQGCGHRLEFRCICSFLRARAG